MTTRSAAPFRTRLASSRTLRACASIKKISSPRLVLALRRPAALQPARELAPCARRAPFAHSLASFAYRFLLRIPSTCTFAVTCTTTRSAAPFRTRSASSRSLTGCASSPAPRPRAVPLRSLVAPFAHRASFAPFTRVARSLHSHSSYSFRAHIRRDVAGNNITGAGAGICTLVDQSSPLRNGCGLSPNQAWTDGAMCPKCLNPSRCKPPVTCTGSNKVKSK